MKKNFLKVFSSAVMIMAAVMNTSCNNEASLVSDTQQEQAGTEGTAISFNLKCAGFGPEQTLKTRSLSEDVKGRVIASAVTNLGDGMEALTEVVEDTKPQTRGSEVLTPAPEQNYTILAYQNGEKKAQWVGEYKNSKFIPKAGSSDIQALQPGKYTFYVFSDHLTFKDGKIIIDIQKGSKNALFNILDIEIERKNIGEKQQVDLKLESPYARVRMKIKGFSGQAFEGSINGALKYKANSIPGTCTIDITANELTPVFAPVTQDGQLKYQHFTDNIADEAINGEVRTSHIITPEDAGVYFLARTHLNKLSFQFSPEAWGTVYKKPVANRELPLNLSDVQLDAGSSYTILQTIYYTADYLFDDYTTVGSLLSNMKKGLKPIAVVVDKDRKICMALKDINQKRAWSSNLNGNCAVTEDQNLEGLRKTIERYDGWAQTWDPNTTQKRIGFLPEDRRRKATYQVFEAFKAVGDLPSAKEKMWYVPGAGEWNSALKYLGIADPAQGFAFKDQEKLVWGGNLGYRFQEILFYQAGGYPLTDWYWAADDWKDYGQRNAVTVTANSGYAFFGSASKNQPTLVRPFINYE